MNDFTSFLCIVGTINIACYLNRLLFNFMYYHMDGKWIKPTYITGEPPWVIEKLIKIKGK